MLQERGGRGEGRCDGGDEGDGCGGGAGEVFEGEEGAEAPGLGGRLVGQGFAEGEEGWVEGGIWGGFVRFCAVGQ